MLTKRIICKLLNVKHTIIKDMIQKDDESIVFDVRPTKIKQYRCGICGCKATPYDSGRGPRLWRAGDWGATKVFLRCEAPRVCCKHHGVIVAQTPWANHNSRFTRDFEELVAWLAMGNSKKAVSELMRITWNTVGAIINRVKEHLDIHPEKRLDNLERIGIDETSYRKGHKYMTVVVNHDTGKVIWLGKGHGKSVLTEFFTGLTPAQRNNIKLVSADGARWISDCIKTYCPQAKRCVDPFHVVTWVMDALDNVRRDAWHDAKKKTANAPIPKRGRPAKNSPKRDTTAADIKGAKYALGKAPKNLTDNQRAKLEFIAKSDNRLYRAYLLKEELRLVFQMKPDAAMETLNHWIKWAQHCRIPVFVELQRKIRRHYDAILASITHGLSNARIEAINNKIKLSIRMAYGFRNMENMFAMIMLRCSDIKVLLPWQKTTI